MKQQITPLVEKEKKEFNSENAEKQNTTTEEKKDNKNDFSSNFIEEDELFETGDISKEVRVCTIGNVDSGKSTLVGVLAKCIKDDGRGSARSLVFNFKHEKTKGQTSSIAQEIMCFKEGKQIEPFKINASKNQLWTQLVKEADKVISIIDLCGHEKYLKTTIFGMTGLLPDYGMIVVGANHGIQRMTKEHIGIALTLKLPIFIVVTKIDLAPENIYKETMDTLSVLLKKAAQKMPVIVRDSDDVSVFAESLQANMICPIFCVSSVVGTGIDKLRMFISKLSPRKSQLFKTVNDKIEYLIDGNFFVQGIGIVVAGTLTSGVVKKNQELYLGPDNKGEFKPVVVKSIHFKRNLMDEIACGNSCCFNIKSNKLTLRKEMFRKGMVLVEKALTTQIAWEFDAEVIIYHHATTIKQKYQSVIHCGNIRQSAKIIEIYGSEFLRTNDKGKARFRFMQSPEFISEGFIFLFREGKTRGSGKILKVYYQEVKTSDK